MSLFRRLRSLFTYPAGSAELTLAQWRAFGRQVPLMYAIVLTNTIILAKVFSGAAPPSLVVYWPAALFVLSAGRMVMWLRDRRRQMSLERARRALWISTWFGAALAGFFAAWGLSLYPYGDPAMRAHIGFYLATTTIVCMFCLMHVRRVSLLVGLCVAGPFTALFLLSGEPVFAAMALNLLFAVGGLLVILITNVHDFAALVASRAEMARRQSETEALLAENHRLANLDSLTGIPNRRSFEHELASAIQEANEGGRPIAVARINIDGFKSVNEIFGQITGDRVLQIIARRLVAARRPSTFIARLDGDNFAVILRDWHNVEGLARIAHGIAETIQPAFETPLGRVRVTATTGLAVSLPNDTPESLYDHADYATWVAKRDARGAFVIFSEQDADELRRVRQMEQLLRNADLDEEIHILLQPQFDVSLGRTTGFEVLARWKSPVLGEVSPAVFIPMAERTGQVTRITRAVLRQAIAASHQIRGPVRLSVNLSANDIGSMAAVDGIVSMFGRSEHPCRIDFEVTETAAMRDLAQANKGLVALLGLGARIALDDFGTGHSSLTHVQHLPLHRIKVDRSFVLGISSDATSRAIVRTIVELCRNLGLSCVFEGVETRDQLEAIASLGGTVIQGYLFGRPMPLAAALDYLETETKPAPGTEQARKAKHG